MLWGLRGKLHTHYQEKLTELCHNHEILEAELTGLRTEEIPRSPTPSVASSQDLPGVEATAVPAEPEMLGAFLPRVCGSPSLQEGAQPGGEVETTTGDMGVSRCSKPGGGKFGWTMIQEAQTQFSQENPLGSFLAKAQ